MRCRNASSSAALPVVRVETMDALVSLVRASGSVSPVPVYDVRTLSNDTVLWCSYVNLFTTPRQ